MPIQHTVWAASGRPINLILYLVITASNDFNFVLSADLTSTATAAKRRPSRLARRADPYSV